MPSDFKTIAKTIADGIKSGVYTETLPSIARLSEQFDVCPATVKRILAQLQDWDLVTGEHGFIKRTERFNGQGARLCRIL